MAGRLEYSSELRHQAPPLEERRLQTIDLSNNALDFFFKCAAGTYTSWARAWLTSLSVSSSKFFLWPCLAAVLEVLSLCPSPVTKVNRGLWAPGCLPQGTQVPWL